MTHRFLRPASAVAVLAAASLVLIGCAPATHESTPSPTATHTKPPVSAAILTAEHVVAQEGLAIALASNVLQSQLQLVSSGFDISDTSCRALTNGGSVRITAVTSASATVQTFTNVIYYDAACQQPYITQQATVTAVGDSGATASGTAVYSGVSGTALGTLTTSAHADLGSGLALEGTGTFALANGSSVSLGLACQPTAQDAVIDCQGGIAQDFGELHESVASITPLVLTTGTDDTSPLTFTGASNSSAVAGIGKLTIGSADSQHLDIQGGTVVSGAPVTTGTAGGFVLFPATPTGWTVTDTSTGVSFTIAVTDNTSRALAGNVTRLSDGKQIATISVDRSGTGTITYLGQTPAPITSWLLSK